jgi:hypothetical protein
MEDTAGMATPAAVVDQHPVGWLASGVIALLLGVVGYFTTRDGLVLRSDDEERVVSLARVDGDVPGFRMAVALQESRPCPRRKTRSRPSMTHDCRQRESAIVRG